MCASAYDGKTEIRIDSRKHLDSLISDGYEITSYSVHSQSEGRANITLVLEKNGTTLRADANNISEYVIHLQSLYDFKRKREIFVWVPKTDLYWDLQKKFVHIAFGDLKSPISIKHVPSTASLLIHQSLVSWVEKHRNLIYRNFGLSKIFYSVCVINAKANNIHTNCYDKESLTLDIINEIISSAQTFDTSFAVSFLLLSEKYLSARNNNEMLVGIMVYDLKARETLCFNITSVDAFYKDNKRDRTKPVLADIVFHLFCESISNELHCKSFVPLPISTEWYTAMPWLTYVALAPIKLDNNVEEKRKLNIPEFLTFGYSEFLTQGNSFTFSPFSSSTSGRATCILKFTDNGNKLAYNLRYDQWSGETYVHADYSFYDPREVKLVEHHPLNLEDVYAFSPDLFIAILAAGMYDANFSTIIEKGLKGSAELVRKNPAYFYPLNHIWAVQNVLDWLNEEPQRYDTLDKLAAHTQLTSSEMKTIEYLHSNFIGVIAEKDGKWGIGLLGDAVRARRYRNQTRLKM